MVVLCPMPGGSGARELQLTTRCRVRDQLESGNEVSRERVSTWDWQAKQRPRGIPSLGKMSYLETRQKPTVDEHGLTRTFLCQTGRPIRFQKDLAGREVGSIRWPEPTVYSNPSRPVDGISVPREDLVDS